MNPRIDTVRTVEAPEGVELSLHVAGPYPRALAYGIDMLARNSVYGVLGLFAAFGSLGMAVVLLCVFVLEWFYPVIFEVFWRGMTPGKRVVGLQVLRDDGTPVGWSESILRNFLNPVDFLPGLWGAALVSSWLSPDFKRLGDRVAGTIVVYVDEREESLELPKVEAVPPPLALTLEEQSALIEFAVRRPTWSAARSEELAGHLSALTSAGGAAGVERALGMAQWIEGGR